ncbi:MAG: glycosyltransferase family 4 protein [Actinobacteria bacterium]|nr:glycosyltransferase family 4 protein [Actinomycetota bacterium]
MPLRVTHCPVNLSGTGWSTVKALRKKGVDARLVVFRPQKWRPDECDINLNRPEQGFLRQQAVQWRALGRLLPQTDIFHFYFGLTLVPKKLQFPILRATRKKCVMHFLGADIRGKTPAQLAYGYRADAQIVGSYSAQRWVPDALVVPPGIDLSAFTPVPPVERERVRIVHAPSNLDRKGTQYVEEACRELPVELDIVHGVPNIEAVKRYRDADIVIDQVLRDWHGLFTIESMAMGKPVVTSLDEEAVRRTEEAFGLEMPVTRATKDDLAERLWPLVRSFEERKRIGAESRAYVEQVHDIDKMADRLLQIYAGL